MRLVSILACTLTAVLINCADKGDEGFFILNVTQPVSSCTFTGDANQPFVSAGQISAMTNTGYKMSPLLESRITAVTGQEEQRTIRLEGANITASVANGGATQNYSVLFSGSLAPNGGTANVTFEALPLSSIKALAGTSNNPTVIILTVKPYGSLGGGRIDGEPFQFPVTVQPAGVAGGVIIDQGVCKDLTAPAITSNPCNPYQDGQIGCCHKSMGTGSATVADPSGALVCPSVAD